MRVKYSPVGEPAGEAHQGPLGRANVCKMQSYLPENVCKILTWRRRSARLALPCAVPGFWGTATGEGEPTRLPFLELRNGNRVGLAYLVAVPLAALPGTTVTLPAPSVAHLAYG